MCVLVGTGFPDGKCACVCVRVPHRDGVTQVGLLLAGLQQRDGRLRKQLEGSWEALQQAQSELESFQVREH